MKIRAAACLIASLLVFPPAARAADANDAASARSFFSQARSLYDSGDYAGAIRLLGAGLEFLPASADALYLRALIEMKDQAGARSAIADLAAALKARSWSEENPDRASLALADLYVRTGRFQDAVALLTPLRQSLPDEPRVLILLARAYGTTSPNLASQAAAEAVRRFPKEADGYLEASRLFQAAGNLRSASSAVSAGLRELPQSLPLMLHGAALLENSALRLKAADAYITAGGTDPEGAVIALESAPTDPQRYLSLFLDNGGLTRRDLTRRMALAAARYTPQASTLRSALESFSGNRDLDADRDGFWEERMEYVNGAPTAWIRDGNQDGVPEFTVRFASGRPETLTFPEFDGGSLSLHYELYPFIDSVTQTGVTTRTSSLTPHVLGCPLQNDSGGIPPDSGATPVFLVPSATQIEQAAYRITETRPGSTAASARMDLESGRRLYLEEDLTADGVIDHRLWYENGVPTRGERALTGDGFMTREHYTAGKLTSITVDANGDGMVDYAEQYDAVTTRLWDYNEDGVWDARERPGAGSTVIREFSTALNGKLNLRITFKADRITGVEKDGKSLPVTPDAKKGVVWIGSPRTSSVIDSRTPEGVVALGGRNYLVFRYAGVAYIEELQ